LTNHDGATIKIPEIGCVAGPAALALEILRLRTGPVSISNTDPNGFAWTVQARAHDLLKPFATV
jgi:hypothetical protein